MSVTLVSIENLLKDAAEFDQMDSNRQGAFRARITRYLKKVEDPQVRKILEQLQEKYGAKEKASTAKVSVEDVETELAEFTSKDTRERGAFKAKVKRMFNTAKRNGETEVANRLGNILQQVDQIEKDEVRNRILRMAEGLDLS